MTQRITSVGSRAPITADIFLCHSSKDKGFVSRLAQELDELKITAWYDDWKLEPGDSLLDRIGAAINSSVFIGVVLSENSVNSNWCRTELNMALSRELQLGIKAVIPIKLGEVDLPPFPREKVYLDFSAEFYRPLAKLCGVIHQIDTRSLNEAIQATPPESVGDIRTLFLTCDLDLEKLKTLEGNYRRLKKLAQMSSNAEVLVAFGTMCFGMNRNEEARDAFNRVLQGDPSFTGFEELDKRVRRLASVGEPLQLAVTTRTAMVYLGILDGTEDYVLNAAYSTTDKEVLLAAGVFYLSTFNADIDAAIGYFVKATEGLSADSDWVRRCDHALTSILKDKKALYGKIAWQYIEKGIAEWNRHKWSLV